MVIRIETNALDMMPLVPSGFTLLAKYRATDTYHVVLGRSTSRLRFCVHLAPSRAAPSIILAHDKLLVWRARAAAAYASLCHRPDADPAAPFMPGAYQRATLTRLIQIADALACGATCKDIAYAVVFPRHKPVSGATWKGSSERRHCWRLIQKTRWYLQDGYRHLLCLG